MANVRVPVVLGSGPGPEEGWSRCGSDCGAGYVGD
jgi:hypothetical protein